MKSKSTIEVNGTRYDATTGAVLGIATAPPLTRSAGRNIDGFFRARTSVTPTVYRPAVQTSPLKLGATPPPSAPELTISKQAASSRGINHVRHHVPQAAEMRTIHVSQAEVSSHRVVVQRGPLNHMRHHAAAHSQTLRRDAVPAPRPSTHNLLKPNGELQHNVPGLIDMKRSAASIDPNRLARAQEASKSPLVAHHTAAPGSILPMFTPVAVQPAPTPPSVAPAPPPNNGDAPTAPPPQPTNKPGDIFEHALANASNFVDLQAHKAHYRRKVHSHLVSMTAGSLALIVIAAFTAYQNNSAVQLKLAGLKAGISASMPNFAAAGFRYDGVRAGNDKLVFGFKNKSGTYQLAQTNTNFSDGDIIQTIGATNASGTPAYSVVQAGKTVVYRFTNTDATWVSGGKWYTLSGTGALSNTQVESLVQHV